MKTQKQVVRVWGLNDWASYYEKPEELDPRVEEVLMAPCPFHKGKTVADTHFAFMGVPDINGSPLTVAKWLSCTRLTDSRSSISTKIPGMSASRIPTSR
jgi:hypothetical protein